MSRKRELAEGETEDGAGRMAKRQAVRRSSCKRRWSEIYGTDEGLGASKKQEIGRKQELQSLSRKRQLGEGEGLESDEKRWKKVEGFRDEEGFEDRQERLWEEGESNGARKLEVGEAGEDETDAEDNDEKRSQFEFEMRVLERNVGKLWRRRADARNKKTKKRKASEDDEESQGQLEKRTRIVKNRKEEIAGGEGQVLKRTWKRFVREKQPDDKGTADLQVCISDAWKRLREESESPEFLLNAQTYLQNRMLKRPRFENFIPFHGKTWRRRQRQRAESTGKRSRGDRESELQRVTKRQRR